MTAPRPFRSGVHWMPDREKLYRFTRGTLHRGEEEPALLDHALAGLRAATPVASPRSEDHARWRGIDCSFGDCVESDGAQGAAPYVGGDEDSDGELLRELEGEGGEASPAVNPQAHGGGRSAGCL